MCTELKRYKNLAFKSSLIIFASLLMLSLATQSFLLIGILIGSSLANINIFILGRAFYKILIKKHQPVAFFGPVLFFLLIAAAAFYLVFAQLSLALGFAVGLACPLLVAMFICAADYRQDKRREPA